MADRKEFKNILAIRNDRFGEFLLNIPALRALKESYPGTKLSIAVNPTVKDLAGNIDFIDNVFIWDDIKDFLRQHRFDLCVVFNPTKEAHVKSFLAGIPVRIGYDRKWGILLTDKIKDTKDLGSRHEVDCNLELVSLIGAGTQDKSISIKVSDSLFSEFRGKKIIGIHPFTSDAVKLWPAENFKVLTLRIREELKLPVVIVGLSVGKFFFPGDVINMVNKTTLPELAALLKRCSLLVSADSGPVHLCASVGTPVIALFRNDLAGKTPKRWGPWGEGHTVIEKNNLSQISVEEVFNIIKERMKE